MSFEVGRLRAALTLDGVSEFHQGLDAAGRKLTETGQKGSSFGRAGEAAIRAAAGATTTLTAAAGAYLTILTKQGVAYNSMQQNSRAALKVLLGGTEQANAQMAKLDDFARNSPFSKSVFIQAQQQLIGFGMEAGKVVPTLDAIQQGVAAMGGSNEQISEVVNILANVNSTGKITAETFNQLGYRGIDGAELLGKAWGKTAAEIRDAVSKGEIDGKEAIDALVESMQSRFGGAADGVKEQWSGAIDRIKAAQRDLGAHIAEPFVSAQGGGMAVAWGNQVADVLRAIEKQAVPVMGILTERGMPFFAELTKGLDSAKQSIQRWDADKLNVQLDKLGNHAPAIAATAGALLALGTNVGPLGKMFSTLGLSANPLLAAFVGLAAASPEVREALTGLMQAGQPLVPLVGELATILSGTLNSALPVVAGGIDLLAGALKIVLGLLEGIPTPVLLGVAAFLAFHKATTGVPGVVQRAADAASNAGGVFQLFGGKVKGAGNALKTAFLGNPVGMALTVISAAVGIWGAANAAAQQKIEDHKQGVAELKDQLDQTTGSLTDAAEATAKGSLADTRAKELAEEMGIAYRDVEQAMLGNAEAQERVSSGMTKHWEENAVTLNQANDALNSWSPSAVNARNRTKELSEILTEHRSRVEEAQQAVREENAALREAAASMSEAGRSNERFNDALATARDVTQETETRLRALKQALDELDGGTRSQAQLTRDLNEQQETLNGLFKETDENGKNVAKSLLDSSGAFDTKTAAGRALYDQTQAVNDQMLAAIEAADREAKANGRAGLSMAEAAAAAKPYEDALRSAGEAAGMSDEQIGAMIRTALESPELVALQFTDNGTTSAVDQQVQGLLNRMTDMKANETIEIDAKAEGADQVVEKMRELGYEVEKSKDGATFEIRTLGAEQATASLTQLADQYVPDKMFTVDADSTEALEVIEGVNVVKVDDKTAYVYGNTQEAEAKIQQVISKEIPGKTSVVSANDLGFWAAWGRIQAEQAIQKTVQIVTETFTVNKGNKFSGDMVTRNFAAGGFPSGMYSGRVGGIWKQGLDGAMHNFAELERGVPWEAYLSGNPAFRERNIGLALEALSRLAFPVVPANQVFGTRAFAQGDVLARRTTASAPPQAPVQSQRRERRRDRGAPLIGTLNLGGKAQPSDLQNLKNTLDDLDRRG